MVQNPDKLLEKIDGLEKEKKELLARLKKTEAPVNIGQSENIDAF